MAVVSSGLTLESIRTLSTCWLAYRKVMINGVKPHMTLVSYVRVGRVKVREVR